MLVAAVHTSALMYFRLPMFVIVCDFGKHCASEQWLRFLRSVSVERHTVYLMYLILMPSLICAQTSQTALETEVCEI